MVAQRGRMDMMQPWISVEFVPGVGHVTSCAVCGAREQVADQAGVYTFAQGHAAHVSPDGGWYGAGDAVAAAAGAAGIASCTPCEKRRKAMNSWLPRIFRRRR